MKRLKQISTGPGFIYVKLVEQALHNLKKNWFQWKRIDCKQVADTNAWI